MELHGRPIDLTSLEFAPIDYRNENVRLEAASYGNGQPLTDDELNKLEDMHPAELHVIYMYTLYS